MAATWSDNWLGRCLEAESSRTAAAAADTAAVVAWDSSLGHCWAVGSRAMAASLMAVPVMDLAVVAAGPVVCLEEY